MIPGHHPQLKAHIPLANMEHHSEDGEALQPPRKRVKMSGDEEVIPASRSTRASISPPPTTRVTPALTDMSSSLPSTEPSPFRLTRIKDLPDKCNVDAVTLKDLVGDPLISELWEFNYLHDIDFLMAHLDEDVKDLVNIHIVHGFWRQEDEAGIAIRAQAAKYKNVQAHTAYMPEAYGTHHTKMMVIFRHDDTAQIVIHTANMIHQDWCNLTQAVWASPSLPLLAHEALSADGDSHDELLELGSGGRFKIDFLNYLRSYNTKRPTCAPLVEKLLKHNFSSIRGTLVGSVPGRHSREPARNTLWGWPALNAALSALPSIDGGEVVSQISSVATLGVTDAYLSKTIFRTLSASSNGAKHPKHKIVFPTADEVRRSLDGYNAGSSIHMKIQSTQHQKQLSYMKPFLHHWAGDGPQHTADRKPEFNALRNRAAPHIKTYLRFTSDLKRLSWALVTSANLSKPAWGEAANAAGDVRIQSYELGVLVWPELWGKDAIMVPVFGKDMPSAESETTVVGFRMPYDLPLTKYAATDLPWCATASYHEPDWKGQMYNV